MIKILSFITDLPLPLRTSIATFFREGKLNFKMQFLEFFSNSFNERGEQQKNNFLNLWWIKKTGGVDLLVLSCNQQGMKWKEKLNWWNVAINLSRKYYFLYIFIFLNISKNHMCAIYRNGFNVVEINRKLMNR
jgi:hypothetical protein